MATSSNNNAIKIFPEVLRTLAFGSISGTYAAVGTGLLHPARLYYLVNATNALLTFSWDGVNDHFVIPANSYLLLDVTSNRTATGGAFMVSQGLITYVKGTAASGNVYLTAFFGDIGLGQF